MCFVCRVDVNLGFFGENNRPFKSIQPQLINNQVGLMSLFFFRLLFWIEIHNSFFWGFTSKMNKNNLAEKKYYKKNKDYANYINQQNWVSFKTLRFASLFLFDSVLDGSTEWILDGWV